MKPVPTATERKSLLLRHPDVSTWVKDRSRPGTANTQLDHLRIFLDRTKLDVDGLVRLARGDVRSLKNVVLDFVREQQGRGLKAKYVGNIWWSVRSFLRSVGVAPDWNPPVEDKQADEDDASRVVPSPEQVRQIANAVKSARDRMVVLVLASSGVRIGTFAVQNGEADGLRLKSLVDLALTPEPHFEKKVPMLRVPAFLSKGKAGYYTGITPDAAEAVVSYLKERQHRGESLSPESPLVAPDPRQMLDARRSRDGYAFIARKSLGSRIQAAMDAVAPKAIRWTPHALRAFASTQFEACEARGLISKTRREYFLGHALGSVDSLYNLGRPLSPQKIEELRASFTNCLPLLSLTGRRDEVDPKQEVADALGQILEQRKGSKSPPMTVEQLVEELAKTLRGDTTAKPQGDAPPIRPSEQKKPNVPAPGRIGEQRLVAASDVEAWLSAGWTGKFAVGDRVMLEAAASRQEEGK